MPHAKEPSRDVKLHSILCPTLLKASRRKMKNILLRKTTILLRNHSRDCGSKNPHLQGNSYPTWRKPSNLCKLGTFDPIIQGFL